MPAHPSAPFCLQLEFIVLIVPVLLAFTIAAELAPGIHVACLLVAAAARCCRPAPKPTTAAPAPAIRLPYLQGYRAMLMVATCLSILAVDFAVFPRRFAKTEMFGVSIMDVGVGSFVFSNALVCPGALWVHVYGRALKGGRFWFLCGALMGAVIPSMALPWVGHDCPFRAGGGGRQLHAHHIEGA